MASMDFAPHGQRGPAGHARAQAPVLPRWFRLAVVFAMSMSLWAGIAVALHWLFTY